MQTPQITADQIAAVVAEREAVANLARAHKITYVEAARRDGEIVKRITGGQLTDNARLIISLKVALASEVDAGQITPEVADYKVQERLSQLKNEQQAQETARLQAINTGAPTVIVSQTPQNCGFWCGFNQARNRY